MTPTIQGTQLPTPSSTTPAEQARQLGLQVGDTIIGREIGPGYWFDARLTLLFIGKTQCLWDVTRRSSKNHEWEYSGEQSNWALHCRQWFKVSSSPPISELRSPFPDSSPTNSELRNTNHE